MGGVDRSGIEIVIEDCPLIPGPSTRGEMGVLNKVGGCGLAVSQRSAGINPTVTRGEGRVIELGAF